MTHAIRHCGHCGREVPVRKGPRRYCDSNCRKAAERCTFPDCDRPRRDRGHCTGHAQQRRKGGPMVPLRACRPRGARSARDEAGRKQCSACGEWKVTTDFVSHRRMPDGLSQYCRPCGQMLVRLAKFNLTLAAYDELLAQQGGVCAICGCPPPPYRSLAVDHDHSCCPEPGRSCGRCIRGLLCQNCNVGIGNLGEDVARLLRAADYLAARSLTATAGA